MVVVSHTHRFIFMKTRKTAGTSIEMLLESQLAPNGHIVNEASPGLQWPGGIFGHRLKRALPDPGSVSGPWREHVPAKAVRNLLGRSVWKSYFRFAAVRNPFDRAVSFFFWRNKFDSVPLPKDHAGQKALFREFILQGAMKTDRPVTHIGDRFILDDVIRYEHLNADLVRIGNRFGFNLSQASMPVTKADTGRSRRPVADFFDRETAAAVRAQMAWVFERFDYSPTPGGAPGRAPAAPAGSQPANSAKGCSA